jgi:hypothetical protein
VVLVKKFDRSIVQLSGLTPLRRYAVAPLRRYVVVPLRRYAVVPLRRYAVAPLRRYVVVPLRLCAFVPFLRFAVSMVIDITTNRKELRYMIYGVCFLLFCNIL